MADEKNRDWEPVAVTLPARYWISVLALVDSGVRETIAPKLEEFRRQGKNPKDLSDEFKAALMGPIFARGEIVKTLHRAGIMTAEANLQFGTDALMALVRRFQQEDGEPKE